MTRAQFTAELNARITDPKNEQNSAALLREVFQLISANWLNLEDDADELGGSSFDPENITTNLVFSNANTDKSVRRIRTVGDITYIQQLIFSDSSTQLFNIVIDGGVARTSILDLSADGFGAITYASPEGNNQIAIQPNLTPVQKKIRYTESQSFDNERDVPDTEWIVNEIHDRTGFLTKKYNCDLLETANVNLASVTSNTYLFDGVALGTKYVFLAGQTDPLENGGYGWVGGAFTRLWNGGNDPIYFYLEAIIIPKLGVSNANGMWIVDQMTNNIDPALISFTWRKVGGGASLGYTAENVANKGANNGYAPLDSGGKVPSANLPSTLMKYIGQYDVASNAPTLTSPDTTKAGYVYDVSVAGTRFGLTFEVGDWLVYNDAGVPEKSDNSDNVITVNGQTGAVVLTTANVADSTNKRYQTDAQASRNDATSSIQTQLNAKAADSNVVHLTGTESIAGQKTFTNNQVLAGVAQLFTGVNASIPASQDGFQRTAANVISLFLNGVVVASWDLTKGEIIQGSVFELAINAGVATGNANITVLNNLANALNIRDLAGNNYLRFISTTGALAVQVLQQLQVLGSLKQTAVTINSNLTISTQHRIIYVDVSANDVTITLPNPASFYANVEYEIKCIAQTSSFQVFIVPHAGGVSINVTGNYVYTLGSAGSNILIRNRTTTMWETW